MRSSSPASPVFSGVTTSQAAPASVSLVGVMFCVMLGPFVNILDYNVVNVALPKMMSGLATDVLTIRWVVTSFLIATAVIMPALGWLGRTVGNRNLYVLGLTVFTTASALCGMAPTVDILIALRVLEGLGAGTLMPMSMVLMMEVYPPEKRGTGTALWGLGATLGSVLGLPLGGYFADAINWRTIFYVNLLPGVLGALCTLVLVPASRRESRVPFDGWGFLALSAALVSLLVALSQGQREGWGSSYILSLITVFGVALLCFILVEQRTTAPLVDLRLYTSGRYVAGTLVALAMGLLFHGSTFLTVLFAQLLLDFSVQLTALALLPGSIAMALTTPLVAWMTDRTDARLPMLLGLSIYCVCCYMMLMADLRIGLLFIAWAYIFRGLGLGFLYPPVFAMATSGIVVQRVRVASSLLNLWVTIGGAFSIAMLSTLVESWQMVHQARFAEEQVLTSVGTQQALAALTRFGSEAGIGATNVGFYALGLLQGVVRQEALVHALNDCFIFVLLTALVSMGVVSTMRVTRHK